MTLEFKLMLENMIMPQGLSKNVFMNLNEMIKEESLKELKQILKEDYNLKVSKRRLEEVGDYLRRVFEILINIAYEDEENRKRANQNKK